MSRKQKVGLVFFVAAILPCGLFACDARMTAEQALGLAAFQVVSLVIGLVLVNE